MCELIHNRGVRIELTLCQTNSRNGSSIDQRSRNPHRHLHRGRLLFRAAVLRDFVSGVIARSAANYVAKPRPDLFASCFRRAGIRDGSIRHGRDQLPDGLRCQSVRRW